MIAEHPRRLVQFFSMKKPDKSTKSHAILDPASRRRKAEKILRVLKPRIDVSNARLLDIGTGAGYIPHHLAQHAKEVTSVDLVDERRVHEGYTFVPVQDETLPFDAGSFDIVVSNHVIEHVGDQHGHVLEVLRVLKPGGIAYFATPNRNWITDPHYRLPFINWMPRSMAVRYLKLTRSKVWDIKPVTARKLSRLVGRNHRVSSLVVDIVKKPEAYSLDMLKPAQPVLKRIPRPLLSALSHVSPTVLLLVTKRH
jgi:SAM-dependent methyltransferase